MAQSWARAVEFQLDNDLFTGSDRNYTNGVRLSVFPFERPPGWADGAADLLFGTGGASQLGLVLGQSIFTPADIRDPAPIPDDRPYAGWLYAGAVLADERPDRLDSLEIELGVVGPAALAEPAQKLVHRLIGSPRPRGWRFQLENEPGLLAQYERRWLGLPQVAVGPLSADIVPHAGGSLGNILTQAFAGFTVRLGQDLPRDFATGLIRPSSVVPRDGRADAAGGPGWFLFAGAEARAVGHDIFLDGNSFRDSPGVERRPLVGLFEIGAALSWGRYRLGYTHVVETERFAEQEALHSYGALSLRIAF